MKLPRPFLTAAATAALALLVSAPLHARTEFLAGTVSGLYRLAASQAVSLWKGGEVRKIMKTPDAWYILTSAGVFRSADLAAFEERNSGLPVKTIKIPGPEGKTFAREVQELKDLEIHPLKPEIMVTATKDAVYLTRDGGLNWKSLGLSAATAGAKAVAVGDFTNSAGVPTLTVFMSHPIYGISWKYPDSGSAAWTDMNGGLEKVPTIKWPDEVSDLAVVVQNGKTVLYASQTFMPRLYRLDWTARSFIQIWKGDAPADTVDGLSVTPQGIVFSAPSGIREFRQAGEPFSNGAASAGTAEQLPLWDPQLMLAPEQLLSAWIAESWTGGRGPVSLSELWLRQPEQVITPHWKTADGKKGNYLPVHQVVSSDGYDAHLKTLKDNGLNMLVVDMKDDIGTLRYDAKDPLVLKKARVGRGIQLEPFTAKAKENGIWLVARIVVFKDKSLASWGGQRYAVWDSKENKPWQGYENIVKKIPASADGSEAEKTETVRKYYEEYWVDPYSEEVWEYNVAVAKELIERGFDEIQFDYIRFPTDGINLSQAGYRWQDKGMDKESALMSFLSYARKEIDAPVSIDIYGANGWYRTGARTGQDVELLARYVDIICPMFYPSHFEQGFLAQSPAEERPYRIYYYGSYRNTIIARNHAIVRPWAQAFYLNVSYDRAWYNQDYVQRQVFGTRDSVDRGYMYWNNSGRYGDLRPDISAETSYPWPSPEAAFSKGRAIFSNPK